MRLQNQMEWLYRAQLLLIYDDKRGRQRNFTRQGFAKRGLRSGVAAPEPSSTGWPENT